MTTRSFWIKRENDWKYINICLLTKWEIVRVPNLVNIFVNINDVVVYPSSKTDTHFIFDFAVLREKWFGFLGNTSFECDCIALEDACMDNQLKALNHYSSTSNSILRQCLFTQDLVIYITPDWKPRTTNHPEKLEVIETYIISDIHKTTYGDQGEPKSSWIVENNNES